MAMEREDYEYQTLVFPKTEAERRRDQRKLECAQKHRRLARLATQKPPQT